MDPYSWQVTELIKTGKCEDSRGRLHIQLSGVKYQRLNNHFFR